MMHFTIKSIVPQPFDLVSENFSEDLFLAIAPSFPPSELLGFDGDRVGGLVKMKFGVGPISQVWISEIVSREANDNKLEFIDVGRKLPPPLKSWEHKHIVQRNADGTTLIVDDIRFSSGLKVLDYMIYPVLKTMFGIRTAAYQKYFGSLTIKDAE